MSVQHIYTAGRENRSFENFIEILKQYSVEMIVDIRKDSESDPDPSFRLDWLRTGIMNAGMIYHWAAMQLGGIRPEVANSRHRALKNTSLRGFADFMDTDPFQRGLNKLIHLAEHSLLLLGDSENPEDCHRSLISDYLLIRKIEVIHLLVPGKDKKHVLNSHARIEESLIVYDIN
ncbi:MAG: DUF488 domain-containing protein [Spirochaetia bacterium]|nr:DUF488 domain-containing protein [Spirochaetia bacterium]